MKTLLLVAAATLMSSSAFAQMAPVYVGNYGPSVQDALNPGEDNNGQFRLGFSSEASAQIVARSTAERRMDDGQWFGNFGNYSANVTAEAFHR
jgi:hypothetical protein